MEKPQVLEKTPKRVNKQSLKYKRDKDRELVRGVFHFYEVPGGSMSFVYKAYKEDPVERFDMIDGQVYTIPLGVAKHLNNNGWYPEHSYKMNDAGVPTLGIKRKVQRFGFESLEFIDITDKDDLATMGTSSIDEVIFMEQKS